jgi:hypothetical protein
MLPLGICDLHGYATRFEYDCARGRRCGGVSSHIAWSVTPCIATSHRMLVAVRALTNTDSRAKRSTRRGCLSSPTAMAFYRTIPTQDSVPVTSAAFEPT